MEKKRKQKRIGKRVLAFAVIIGMMPIPAVWASSINEANQKKEEAQSGLNSANSDISKIENEQAQLQGEINSLDAELVSVIMNLSILENELTAKEAELVQVQADLVQAQADEDAQYEAMKMRIRFMYERGDNAFLTSLLESKNITDFLNRVEYVNEVYEYDRNLLTAYEQAKQKVADLEVQVQSEIAEMEEVKENYQDEQARYETVIAQKKSQMSDFDSKLASAKQLAAQYQATIDRQNEIIRQEEERIRKEEEERKRREEEARRQQEAEARRAAAANNANNNSNSSSNNNSGNSSSDSGSGSSGGGSSSSGGNLNPDFTTGVSGSAVVNYACTFIGKPYVWGGTDPNTGADCSGFIQYVYRNFGISLPRSSYEQLSAGKEVSYANAQPGDIICYSGHVAIYMGGGQIVHASNSSPYPAGGIKTGSATYRTIISVRRVL